VRTDTSLPATVAVVGKENIVSFQQTEGLI
jgi:hypothetical protein